MPDNVEGFSGRLKELIGGQSERGFARLTGIGVTSLQNYLKGQLPGIDKAALIARAAGVSLEWLITGEGEKQRGMLQPHQVVSGGIPTDFVLVPSVQIRPSAGPGAISTYEEGEPDVYAFREAWLRGIGVSPRHARLMIAQGDSMKETISEGDLMIVDMSVREVINGAIYVLVYGGSVILKRLQLLRNGVLVLISDNSKYRDEEVPLIEQPELIIEGRVKWAGRTL